MRLKLYNELHFETICSIICPIISARHMISFLTNATPSSKYVVLQTIGQRLDDKELGRVAKTLLEPQHSIKVAVDLDLSDSFKKLNDF